MKEIPLTKGKVALVDDQDYDYLMQWKWHLSKGGYAARTLWVGTASKPFYMHLAIMPPPPGTRCDHIDRNQLNNQRGNLRFCTQQQNCFNRPKHKNGRSQYKGVYPKGRKWIASITFNYKRLHIGSFATEIEAALAYNQKAKEIYGDFAYLNPVQENQHDVGASAG